jgi:hypothetical protein
MQDGKVRQLNTRYIGAWKIYMAFTSLPGLKGKVYTPEEKSGSTKKHPCNDCYSCQMCSDNRCRLCIEQGPRTRNVCHKNRDVSCSKNDKG